MASPSEFTKKASNPDNIISGLSDQFFLNFLRLVQKVFAGTADKPAACNKVNLTPSGLDTPFKKVSKIICNNLLQEKL